MDRILIENLSIRTSLFSNRNQENTFLISASFPADIRGAAESDSIAGSIDYHAIAKEIHEKCEGNSFEDLISLGTVISNCRGGASCLNVSVEQVEGFPESADCIGIEVSLAQFKSTRITLVYFARNLKMNALIGVYAEERRGKQPLNLDLKFQATNDAEFHIILQEIQKVVSDSRFFTLEALVTCIAEEIQKLSYSDYVNVKATKPKALEKELAKAAGVEVTRGVPIFQQVEPAQNLKNSAEGEGHKAYIAFGSNIEPRIKFINGALQKIKKLDNVKILSTSFLYESLPMYHIDQGKFYNGVIQVGTSLSPLDLLETLQGIQAEMGRVKEFENGPRNIDLDIIFYDNEILDSENLKIPHPRAHEREFVLRPISDIAPDLVHPALKMSMRSLLDGILRRDKSSLQKVLPFPLLEQQWEWSKRTFVMGILNVSPDSFSEPGIIDPEAAVKKAAEMESAGVDIVDIGAVSRRPGADEATPLKEEISLLVPLIQQLRKNGLKVPVSVDVTKCSVARAAIAAGADLVNDLGMGRNDHKEMYGVVAESEIPICIMHTRGEAKDMNNYANYGRLVEEIRGELFGEVERALSAGIYRWNIILDPGIGFAKTGEQNMEILRHFDRLNGTESQLCGYPWLVGCSRKRFIGTLTGVEDPIKRGPGSMAAVAASISVGSDVVRVHDVPENVQVAKFSDAFWRRQ